MKKLFVSKLLSAIFFLSLGLQAISQTAVYKEIGRPPQQTANRNGQVIYDQFYPLADGSIVSNAYTDPGNLSYSCIAADDFVVPAGDSWGIRYIDIAGQYWEWTGTPIDALNIYLYADNGGIPGDILHSFENFTSYNTIPIDAGTHLYRYEIMLPSVINLTAGHYWVGVQAVSDFTVSNRWGWLSHESMTIENEYQWKNPGDGYGYGYTDWTPASYMSFSNFNLAFALYGDGLDNDMAMVSIDSPVSSQNLTASELITITVKNEGLNTETGFQVSYSIDGGTPVTETVTSLTLAPNQIAQYTFTTPADFSVASPHEITATVSLAGDPVSGNNSKTKIIYNLGTVYPMPATGTQTITSCGATFTDSGGLEGNFGMNDNAVTTIYPAIAGDRVRLTFLEFNASYGGFKVYDGTSTNANLLGNWTGANSPGILTALNSEGALTIHFQGPGWEETSGWVAFISCVTPVEDDLAILDFTSSLTTIFQNNTTILSANIQNLGSQAQEKTVTFKANGNIIGTRSTGLLNTADTAWVQLPWTATEPGQYTLEASIPEDQGPEPDNTASFEKYVYPFDAFFEDFEGSFPPENWIAGINWGQNNGGFSGNYSAVCMVQAGFSDTLVTTRLNIGSNASFSFYAVSSMWWPGDLQILWKEDGTNEWIHLMTPVLNAMQFGEYTVDMAAFAGHTGRIAFVDFVSNPYAWSGMVKLDYILGQNISVHYDDFDLKVKAFDGNRLYMLGESSEFSLTIRNNGLETLPAASYRVKLMVGTENPLEVFSLPGEEIDFQEEISFTLSYTFPEIGEYHIYAEVELTNDQSPDNNVSNVLVLSGVPAQSTIGLTGEKSITLEYPIDMAFNHSLSETIYTNEEIGQEGVIFGISWDYLFSQDELNVPVRIWAGLTDVPELNNGWVPAGDLIPVFDGSLTFLSGQQTIYIPFSTPINYNDPTKNIAILVEKIADHTSMNQFFWSYGTTFASTLLINGYTNPPDPFNPQGGGQAYMSPFARFIFNDQLGAAAGTVTDPDGVPIEGASITVEQLNITTHTGTDGTYELPYIPAGTYPATADKFGFTAVTHPLQVTLNNTTTLDFVMGEMALVNISGTVSGIDNPGIGIENAVITLSGYHSYTTVSGNNGVFLLENVYSQNTYQISIAADGYTTYMAPVVVTDTDIDLGEIVLNEAMLIPYIVMAEPVTGSMEVTWNTPTSAAQHTLVFEDGVHEQGWAGETGEEVWLGNYIPFEEPATITGFDLYWAKYSPLTTAQPMRLDIFDEDYNLIVSSGEFMSGMDAWIHVPVPNITLEGDHYAMVYWNGTPAQSSYLGWDSTEVVTEYARYKYAGGDIAPLSGIVGGMGTFLIRPHVMTDATSQMQGRTLTGYDIRFGRLNDIANAATWPLLNAETLDVTTFNDTTWPPDENDMYVYAVTAFYTTGQSTFSFSNVINYVGVGTGIVETGSVVVYPNPASESVTISNCNGANVLLFTMDGSLKLQARITGDSHRLNLNNLASGTYLLVIQTGDGIKQQKLIVK